jgi:hypothetical protein
MSLIFGFLALVAANDAEPPLIPAFFTGDRLLEICMGPNPGQCSMYVAGVADGIFHAETGEARTLCSGDLNNRDARKIVTDYLLEHPQVREHAAAVAVELALKPMIGCNDQAAASTIPAAS